MKDIIGSASKIVLLHASIALSLAFLFVVLTKQVEGGVVADIFKVFLGAVAGFYFAHKGDTAKPFGGK